MDFLKEILEQRGAELVGGLVGKAGFTPEQARAFVPEAAGSVVDAIQHKAGELDLSDPVANVGPLVDAVDTEALAAKVGIDASQAASGLGAIVPTLLSAVAEKAGGLSKLTSLLGGEGLGKAFDGGADALGGVAGKLFGK